jgi:hypothetical protein
VVKKKTNITNQIHLIDEQPIFTQEVKILFIWGVTLLLFAFFCVIIMMIIK